MYLSFGGNELIFVVVEITRLAIIVIIFCFDFDDSFDCIFFVVVYELIFFDLALIYTEGCF